MSWNLTKKQWIIALIYSALFPVLGFLLNDTVVLIIYIPFLPIGYIGGMALVDLFNTENAYIVGVVLTIFLQIIFIMMNLAYYAKRDKTHSKKLIKRISFIVLFFIIGVIVIMNS